MKNLKFFSIFLILFLLLPLIVQAQSNRGTILQPVLKEFTANKGDVIDGSVVVTNDAQDKKPIKYGIFTRDFTSDNKTEAPQILDDKNVDPTRSLSKWIEPAVKEVTVDHLKTYELKYKIRVPKNANAGSYYGVVFFAVNPPANLKDDNIIGLGGSVGQLIFLNVKGDVDPKGEIAEFRTDRNSFIGTPVGFFLNFKNTGNVSLKPAGVITIYTNDFNKPIKTIDVNQSQKFVLANSSREFTTPEISLWNDSFIEEGYDFDTAGKVIMNDKGEPKTNFKINWDKIGNIRWGDYKAKLLLTYNFEGKSATVEKEIKFTIVPWPVIIFILLVLAIVVTFFIIKSRKNKK